MKHYVVTVDVTDGKKKVPFFLSQQILTHYAYQCIQKSCNLGNILCTKAASACSILARKKTQWGEKKNNVLFIDYDDFLVFPLNILSLLSVIAFIHYCSVSKL